MGKCDTKVVGYFAYLTKLQVVCTEGKACLIAGSEHSIKEYINEIHPGHASEHTIRKTRFGEIKQGLLLGAAYAFDKKSYGRFYPLAKKAGGLNSRCALPSFLALKTKLSIALSKKRTSSGTVRVSRQPPYIWEIPFSFLSQNSLSFSRQLGPVKRES